MDTEIRSWMVGVGFESEEVSTPVERVRLSGGQKRELAGLTGLMMASTVFFLTPLVLSTPEPSLEMAPLERTAVTLAVPVAAHASVPAPAPAAVLSGDHSQMPAARAPRGSSGRIAAPLVTSRAFVSTHARNTPGTAAGKGQISARRKGISTGLMRALVGSGRYRVQPFPSPTAN